MANARYLLPRLEVLSSALSMASKSQTNGLPRENVKTSLIRQVYRSTGKTSEWIRFRFAAATTIDTLFIGNHNFTKDAVLYWQGNSTSNFATPALSLTLSIATDSQANPITKFTAFWRAQDVGSLSHKHWRLSIDDTGNASSNIQIGRIMGGRYSSFSRNMSDGFSVRTTDPSRGKVTMGRQTYWNQKTPFDEIGFSIGLASKVVQDEWIGIFNEVGQHTPFLLAISPDTRPIKDSYYGQFMGGLNFRQRVNEVSDLSEISIQEKN